MKQIIESYRRAFDTLDDSSRRLLSKLGDEQLFAPPEKAGSGAAVVSVGEYLVRSAAVVERTFGGITTRLWDDPFEWTLPEKLINIENTIVYLDEVVKTRQNGFGFFASDVDLLRQIPAPRELKPLIDILTETLSESSHLLGRAFAVFQMISDDKLPRI